MSFTFVTYKIKDYEFTGIADILSNKSEYFKTIDLDKQAEITLSSELIQNELEYKIFELLWKYINSLVSINFIDDLNLEELKYVEYLTNYFNINLNELEIKYIIDKETEFSESKEQIYSTEDINKFNYDILPLSGLDHIFDLMLHNEENVFVKTIDPKNPFILNLKLIQEDIISLEDDVKRSYKDGEFELAKYQKYELQYYQNIQKIIEIDKIKIKKITLNIDIGFRDYQNNKYYITNNKADTYYNYDGFKYGDIFKLIYNYEEINTGIYGIFIKTIRYKYNSLDICITFSRDINDITKLPFHVEDL